jgi:hypothetical protein
MRFATSAEAGHLARHDCGTDDATILVAQYFNDKSSASH